MSAQPTVSEAVLMVHWPGQDTPACAEHARKLEGVAKVMGFVVTATPTSGVPCKNCENAGAAKK